jgi:6-phosphogluconolactonase
MYVYVGAYTTEQKPAGISVFKMDESTGALDHIQTVLGLNSPTFLALHPTLPLLYTVERHFVLEDPSVGAIAALAINQSDGTLNKLNRVKSGGTSPAYVGIAPDGRAVFAAHYLSGHVSSFPLSDTGALGEATTVIHHEGNGPDERRQTGPHAHSIIADPTGQFVLACDLGIDKVMVYRLEGSALVPNIVPYGQVGSGGGPRHITFHPSGKFVYVINEIGNTITGFAWDAGRGTLTHIQHIDTLPADYTGTSHTAQIIAHPNGRFIYGSNRGHDTIAIFRVDEATGRLTAIGHESTQGKVPRNFNVDPSGTFLLAANQDSDTIVTFRIDPTEGTLNATGHVTQTPSPVCIMFRPE